MRKYVVIEVVGYGSVECVEHGGRGQDFSWYFASLALQVNAPSLAQACRVADQVVAAERERQMADSMW